MRKFKSELRFNGEYINNEKQTKGEQNTLVDICLVVVKKTEELLHESLAFNLLKDTLICRMLCPYSKS